jgi:hypothetical protein
VADREFMALVGRRRLDGSESDTKLVQALGFQGVSYFTIVFTERRRRH